MYVDYFLTEVDLHIVLIFPGISNRIVSFANVYNQLKILVVVVRLFVKRIPGPLCRADNHKHTEIGWGHLKIFPRTIGPEKLRFT
jgi:hypothetical protein